jgi:hypothetical protein
MGINNWETKYLVVEENTFNATSNRIWDRCGEVEKTDSFRKEEKNLLIITSLEPGLGLLE